jgi:hypothetical protein
MTHDDQIIRHIYSFNQKLSDFKRIGKVGKTVLKEFSDYLRDEHQLELNGNVAEIFNQSFKINIETNFANITTASFAIYHQISDHSLKVTELKEVFRMPLNDIVHYDRYHSGRTYSLILGSILEYLKIQDIILNADTSDKN